MRAAANVARSRTDEGSKSIVSTTTRVDSVDVAESNKEYHAQDNWRN